MHFHPDLKKKIFQLPVSVATEVYEHTLEVTIDDLYNETADYFFPSSIKFDKPLKSISFFNQMKLLLEAYITLGEKYKIKPGYIQLLKKHLDKWTSSTAPYPGKDQEYYKNIKKLFERSYPLFKETFTNNFSKAKKEFHFLCQQLDECPTGIYGALERVQGNLISPQTLPHWVEKGRHELIELIAANHYEKLKEQHLSAGKKRDKIEELNAHIYQAFHKISYQLGFTTFIGEAHKEEEDIYFSKLNITKLTKRQLVKALKKTYTPKKVINDVKICIENWLIDYKNIDFNKETEKFIEVKKFFAPFINNKVMTESDLFSIYDEDSHCVLHPELNAKLSNWIRELLVIEQYLVDSELSPIRTFIRKYSSNNNHKNTSHFNRMFSLIDKHRAASRRQKVILSSCLIRQCLANELRSQSRLRKAFKQFFSYFGLSFLFQSFFERHLLVFKTTIDTLVPTASCSEEHKVSEQFQLSLYQLNQLHSLPTEKMQLTDIQKVRLSRLEDSINKGRLSISCELLHADCIKELLGLDDHFFDANLTKIFSYISKKDLKLNINLLNKFLQKGHFDDEQQAIRTAIHFLSLGGSIELLCTYRQLPQLLANSKEVITAITLQNKKKPISDEDIQGYIDWWKEKNHDTHAFISHFFTNSASSINLATDDEVSDTNQAINVLSLSSLESQ